MTSLELAYGVYKLRPIRRANPRKRANYPVSDLSKPTPPFKPPLLLREGSKSVEPQRLPQLRSVSPDFAILPGRKEEAGVPMDKEIDRLESLAMRNVCARSELLAIQQRLVDISVKTRLEARPRKLPPLS